MGREDERTADFEGDARRGLEHPPERLSGGGRRPAVVGILMAVVIGLVLWQPWASGVTPPVAPSALPSLVAVASASAAVSPTGTAVASAVASPPPRTTRTAFYTTVTDNEWTVVALLAQATPVSTEEPATQHPVGTAWSLDRPFLVLQQGLTPVAAPVVGTAASPAPCPPVGLPRDRIAVPLPAGRVAFLGITVPSGVPRPEVTARLLGSGPATLARAAAPAIRLAGMDAATRYVIPTAGPGAAVLFTGDPAAAMAPGAYQFTVASPGAGGTRYLYACIAS